MVALGLSRDSAVDMFYLDNFRISLKNVASLEGFLSVTVEILLCLSLLFLPVCFVIFDSK